MLDRQSNVQRIDNEVIGRLESNMQSCVQSFPAISNYADEFLQSAKTKSRPASRLKIILSNCRKFHSV
jgi:hypothetical protein